MTNANTLIDTANEAGKELFVNHAQLKDGFSLIGYELRNWSGKKTFREGKVTAHDSSGKVVELPSDLVTPGRKSLLDTRTHLSFCNKFQTRFGRIFSKYTISFMNMKMVSDSMLQLLIDEADEAAIEYDAEVEAFLAKYEGLITEWCGKHPGLESVIRDGYPTVEEVRSRFKLKIFKPVRFSPKNEEDLAEIVGEAAAQLFEDISKEAQMLLRESLTIKDGPNKGTFKEGCTQDIKRPIRRLRDKVFSLYMLDPVFEGIVDVFDDLLDKALPEKGRIQGDHFANLMAHVMMMTDTHKLKLHASGINQIAKKVAEVEKEQEAVTEEQPVEQPSVAAQDIDTDIDDVEAELLRQLAKIRASKGNQQANAKQPATKPSVQQEQPVTQPMVEDNIVTEPVVTAPVETQPETMSVEVPEQPQVMVEVPLAGEMSIEVPQTVVAEEAFLADTDIEIDIDISNVALDTTSVVTEAPQVPAQPATTSGFFF